MEIETDKIVSMSQYAINHAKKAGMDGAYINANIKQTISTRFANSAIHQNFADSETFFQIAVIKGKKRMEVNVNSLKEEKIVWAINRAVKIVNYFPDDPEFPGILTESQKYPKLKLNDPKARNLTPIDLTDKIISGINTGHEFSPKVQTVSGNLNFQEGIDYYLSSEGHENLSPVTAIASTINIMADDGHGESRSNSSFGGRIFAEIPFEMEAKEVAERAISGLKPQKIEPGSYEVILDHQAAADQAYIISRALSARLVVDQQSFFKDKVGDQVFADSFTLNNDPHDPSFLSSCPLDNEGVASQKFTLINKGVLESFAHDRLTASMMDTKSNGCKTLILNRFSVVFPFASKIVPGQKSHQKMVGEMDDGLLITNLHYTNFVDMPRGTETGMTKDGVFIIKNGEIIGAAHNLRFTDSIPRMFSTAELSTDVRQVLTLFGVAYIVPTIKINSMNLTSPN